MNSKLPPVYDMSSEVVRARALNLPLVALESTVITHGLPFPENLDLARSMENEVRGLGAVPATIAVLDGRVCIGLNELQLERLANGGEMVKVSARDFGPALAGKLSGGTTVAGTMFAAHAAGLRVFATGGIGGVHRQAVGDPSTAFDISADLVQLGRIPMVVICAGAKAILDLRATLEVLETLSVPVIGYQTGDFPAFYSRSSGLETSGRADTPEEIAQIARLHWQLGHTSAVLVTQPPPDEAALPNETVDQAVNQALREAQEAHIRGQAVTPFLLGRVKELTSGDSLRANIALLENNARLAAQVARYLNGASRHALV